MKFYALALSLVLFSISACQNSDPAEKAAKSAENTATPSQKETQAPVLDMAQLQKTAADAQATATEMENLLKSLDDLPADVKKKQAAIIASSKNDLSGMLEKQRDMQATFNKVLQDYAPTADGKLGAQQSSDAQIADPVTVAKDCTAQFDQYAQSVMRYRERIQKLKEGKPL